jgi:hypothetical protein
MGEVLARYAYGDTSSPSPLYYHSNQLGSTMALTDPYGDVVETYEYDVFGMPDITQDGGTNNRFLFGGWGWDADIGLYNYEDVAYDPFLLGRIVQRYVLGDELPRHPGVPDNLDGFPPREDKREGEEEEAKPKEPQPKKTEEKAIDWGSGETSKGNCYRYAVNDPYKPGEEHSYFPGGRDPGGVITCEQLMNSAKKDGLVEPNKDGTCPEGHRKIAGAVQDPTAPESIKNNWNDYHWYRQEKDGTWTNKLGEAAPSNKDFSGKTIKDPEKADRGTYTSFCGYLCVPPGLDLEKPKGGK